MHPIRTIAAAVALVLGSTTARAAIIHVPADEPTIQDAIDVAVDGDEIVVAPGTYSENLALLGKTLTLRASDPDPAITVIDGGALDPVLVMSSGAGPETLVEGFTLRNGHQSGIFTTANATIRGCVFEDNEATSGGAIDCMGADVVVEDCTFRNNHATAGGAVFIASGDVRLRRCDFDGNDATTGGAIVQTGGDLRVSKCRFRDNTANHPAVAAVTQAEFSNCLVRDNGQSRAIQVDGTATFANCTMVRNGTTAIDADLGAVVTIVNSIVRNHDLGPFTGVGTIVVDYSNIQGGYAGTGNIDEAAGFVDGPGNDFRLAPLSPCIDAGDNGGALGELDLGGIRRVINDPDVVDTGAGASEIIDMGCYERLPRIRYVDASAIGSGTGHAWNDGYIDLQDALDEARAGDVGEIWVASGIYKPDRGTDDPTLSFEMVNGLDIRGGYAGDELERNANDPALHETVLGGAIGLPGTADNTHHVVTATNVDETGRLIGFIVQKGHAQAAIGHGGGIYIDGGGPVIRECIVRQNEASLGGAGIYSKDADTSIHRCRVNRNVNLGAVAGAGISLLRGEVLVTNSFIFGNEGDGLGIGLYNLDADTSVVNTTIHGNASHANWNAGVFQPGGTIELVNTIVWGNRGSGGSLERQQLQDSGTSFVVDYSCIEGWTGFFAGVGSFGDDPLFADADGPDGTIGTADDDVHLLAGSPAIDAGDSAALPTFVTFDLDGDWRYLDDPDTTDTGVGPAPIVDLGPYEFGTTCDADVVRDGVVNIQDLLAVLGAWGCVGCAEDVDGNGAVDIGDVLAVLATWGPCA